MIDWALDQFSEDVIWALMVLGVIAVIAGVFEAARFLKKNSD
jgi:F0F1-type ATP synthase assembly protein I